MISILMADDHPLILRGLSDLFANSADFNVVDTVTDGCGVIDAVACHAPDVLILDLMMPGMSGMAIIRELARCHAGMGIVVLSMHANVAHVWEALSHGAHAYVLKCGENEELIHAVREAHGRRRYVSPAIAMDKLNDYAMLVRQERGAVMDKLTRRELQVLHLAAVGKTSAEIARQFHIGIRTVETHRANLLRKLSLRNQSELVRYAIKHGLIPAESGS